SPSPTPRSWSPPPPADVDEQAVRAWWDRAARDLPWRHTRDPWAVLVSEVMLQQTQVERVVPRWHRFLARFPDPPTCASAPAGDVIDEWSGLGYNRRALALHRAATQVTERHQGRLPSDLGDLLELPGVGAYTARAVLAFAFEADHGVLDTNVARVVARRAGRSLGRAEAQAVVDDAVPAGGAWWWNQAMIDLGARVCVARSPRCGECPVRTGCAWRGGEDGSVDPAIGSASVSGRQSRFEGSDRQGRGRLVAALREGEVARGDVARTMGWPDDPGRAEAVLDGLVRDGLVVAGDAGVRLP
ncbi:MAG: A/G-specific adenine glycosylase, partial [Actinomycetota bacterium]